MVKHSGAHIIRRSWPAANTEAMNLSRQIHAAVNQPRSGTDKEEAQTLVLSFVVGQSFTDMQVYCAEIDE